MSAIRPFKQNGLRYYNVQGVKDHDWATASKYVLVTLEISRSLCFIVMVAWCCNESVQHCALQILC